MVDGTSIDVSGLLFPLRLDIYVRTEGRKRSQNLVGVGEAWRFIDANLGVEAQILIDEDRIPDELRDLYLYPSVDLSTTAILGDNLRRLISKAETRAIYLEDSSFWEMMPPIYWPDVPPVQYMVGTAQAIEVVDVLGDIPEQPAFWLGTYGG